MGLKLICGPTGSGKTTRAIEAFLTALDEGRRAAFISPSYPDARHFQRQLLARRPAFSGSEVITFGSLCNSLLDGTTHAWRRIGEVERRMLLRLVIASQEDELSVLRESSTTSGFVAALERLIIELEGAGITPEGLASAARGVIYPRGMNDDLFHLFDEYQAVLRQLGVIDGELAQRQALDLLKEQPSQLPYDTVVVDGFWDFTPLQDDILAGLEEAGAELVITAPWEEGRAVYAATGQHFEALIGRAGCEALPSPAAGDRPPALAALDRELFDDASGSAAETDPTEAVYLFESAGERGQAEMVAAEILRLWRDRENGVRLDDIAVVCPSLGDDARQIASILTAYGVPNELLASMPLGQTPLGQALLALIEFTGSRMAFRGQRTPNSSARKALLKYLRSSLPVADTDRVDGFAREAVRRDIIDPEELLALWRKFSRKGLPEVEELQKAAGSGLKQLGETVGAIALRLMRERMMRDDSLGGLNDTGGAQTDLCSLKELSGVLDELRSFPDQKIKGAEALELLADGIRVVSVRLPSARYRDCVRILDPHRVLNQRFDVVFMCSLLESRFPSPGREEPFLSDRVRGELKAKGLNINSNQSRLDEERFLFHRALTRARKRVYLCHPYCDREGKQQVRSLFVDEALEKLGPLPEGQHCRRTIAEVAYSTGQAPVAGEALLALCLEAGRRRPAKGQLPAAARKNLLAAAREAGLADGLEHCLDIDAAVPGAPFSHPEVMALFGEKITFSPSQLEAYAGCPYKYFISYHLQPAEMSLDTFHLDRGSLAHAVLKNFFTQIKSHAYLGEADAKQLEFLRQEMRRLVSEEVRGYGLGTGAETALVEFTLSRFLVAVVDREAAIRGSFRPDRFEVSFGREGDPAGPLNLGDDLLLAGKIDRVDRCPDDSSAIVIDYKMSGKVTSWDKYEEKRKLQLPLYTLALAQLGYRPVGGEYYALMADKRRGFYLDDSRELFGTRKLKGDDLIAREDFERLLEDTRARALELARGIRSANFSASDDGDVCKYCDFEGICRLHSRPGEVAG